MKYILPFLFLLPLPLMAQQNPETIIQFRSRQVERVIPQKEDAGQILIPAAYGKSLGAANLGSRLKNKQIISVELVYTRFRRSEKYNQQKLNLQRLQNLRALIPSAFSNESVEWIITEQTGAADFETGKTYFHGFIIHTRTLSPSETERKAEITGIMKLLEVDKSTVITHSSTGGSTPRNTGMRYDTEPVKYYDQGPNFSSIPCALPNDVIANIKYPAEAFSKKKSGRVKVEFTVNKFGDTQDIQITESAGYGMDKAVMEYVKTMPKWTPAKSKGTAVNAYVSFIVYFSLVPEELAGGGGMPCEDLVVYPEGIVTDIPDITQESTTVSKIFERHNWQNLAVVCDVTASMGPYIGDLMKWFRNNSSRIKHFTFFNDGDQQKDNQKQIGSTGGLYQIPATGSEEVEKELYRAMRNGYGGDLPENDIEAILETERNTPFAERIVWVADNYAFPRDVKLIPEIKKPVSIIICSAGGGVNPAFLTLARNMKASLHTLETDLPDLSRVKEGEKVNVNGREYELKEGKFIRVY